MIHLQVSVDNAAELLNSEAYDAGALLRWESAPTEAGTYVEGGTVPLVDGTSVYDIWDTTGVAGTWYRTRISDAGGTTFSAYSALFTEGSTYATIGDVEKSLMREEDGDRERSQIQQALAFGIDRITEELDGIDFFRHPASGTETWLADGNGRALLHVHRGIVSLTLVRIRYSRMADWISLDETEWDLEALGAFDRHQDTAVTVPFDHVRLNPTGGYATWPKGHRSIEFTGVRGWPVIPSRAVEANVAMARQIMAADRTYPGGVLTPGESGIPILPSRLPDAVYRLKAWHSNLYAACYT